MRDLFEALESPPRGQFDPELARDGSEGFYKVAHMFLFSLVGLGMVNILATLVGKSFLSAGYTTHPSVERMRQSLRQVVESFLPGGLERHGDGWRMTARARLVHAQAGRKLLLSGNWEVADSGVPLSAAHVAYAPAAFSALTLPGVYQLGVRPTLRQREGYMHIWRYVGCLVGVPEELSPCSEDERMALVRVGRICEPPPEVDSIIIARTIVNSAALALGVFDNKEKRRRLELGQTRDVRYFMRAAEMVLPAEK